MAMRLLVVIYLIFIGFHSIGCDGIAGSQRRLDRCGICGGDNSTCRLISGIFTRPQLPVGYNMVAHIPRGACNLNITQIKKSPNYLALRRNDGTYILNGNWAISWPGEYDGVGSKFIYVRQNSKSLESIEAVGPLLESIDLLVLSQQPNPGIKYEYMLALSDTPIETGGIQPPAPLTYRGSTGNNQRSPTFLPLLQSPPRTSLQSPSNSIRSHLSSESAYSTRPEVGQASEYAQHGRRRHQHHHQSKDGSEERRFAWKVTGYTNCTESCGGGTQQAIVRCVREISGAVVSDRRCEASEKPSPQPPVRCNLRPCPAEWTVGPWSSCSEVCGEGFQSRTTHCQQRISPTLTMRVAEGNCLNPQPESRKSCFLKACHRWETTPWTPCSTTCGNGIRSRVVRCINSDRESTTECPIEDKPFEISPCNMGPCEGLDWFVSDWSKCTATCGNGIQTRQVLCTGVNGDRSSHRGGRYGISSRETETNLIDDSPVDDAVSRNTLSNTGSRTLCDDSRKPNEEKECLGDRECLHHYWFTGPWSDCSATCGNGFRSRQVVCVSFSSHRGKLRIVDESECDERSKPESKSKCNVDGSCPSRWFTTEWNECGGEIQRRSVSCRGSNWTLSSTSCLDEDRPLDHRSCNDQERTSIEVIASFPRLPVPAAWSRESDSRESNSYVPVRTTKKPMPTRVQITTPAAFLEPNEEPDSSECTDQYKNCALVVQARLCRYKYYRSVCCTSCADNY